MKLWRNRTADAYSRITGELIDTLNSHTDQLVQLHKRVTELERAIHDHCIHCGQATPRIGMTECGRTDCSTTAHDYASGGWIKPATMPTGSSGNEEDR